MARPTAITLAPASVAENLLPFTTVGLLGAVDPDPGETFSFALVGGDIAFFTIDGGTLRTAQVLDFETDKNHSVTVEVTDSTGLTFRQRLSVAVENNRDDPLAYADHENHFGVAGGHGADGAFGGAPGQSGTNGLAAGAGESVLSKVNGGIGLPPGPLPDVVVIQRTMQGGDGGTGGNGGGGAEGVFAATGPDWSWGPGGAGGGGGSGGAGGSATGKIVNATYALGGDAEGSQLDSLFLRLTVTGERGGGGGAGGTGGDAGYDGTTATTFFPGGSEIPTTSFATYDGSAGGRAGNGAAAGAGGAATAIIDNVAVLDGGLSLSAIATAVGGVGGNGFDLNDGDRVWGNGGRGATAGAPGKGAAGGAGGNAEAAITVFTLDAEAPVQAVIEATARGGDAGHGGAGGIGGTATNFSDFANQTNATSGGTVNIALGRGGNGGAGGKGGSATATFADSAVTLGDAADNVTIYLSAVAGARGAGGLAGPEGIDPFNPSSFATVVNTTHGGTGAAGKNGKSGVATVEMLRDVIDLGGGDDYLLLGLDGAGSTTLAFSGNQIAGGTGRDDLSLANVTLGGAVLDLVLGTIAIDGSPSNILTGFETFRLTGQSDSVIDAAGDNRYQGDAGTDSFTFRPGHGHDVVVNDAGKEVITLAGFGAALDSFAEVLAAATDVVGFPFPEPGVVIATGPDTWLLIAGAAKAGLKAADFLFAA